jgi:YggT family protein
MSALIFILDSLLMLALFIFLARLLLQWVRADFRNPIAQAVVRLTNPLILPLRRILPPVGKVDTASVVAVVLVATIKIAILAPLTIYGSLGPEQWLRYIALELIIALLSTYLYAIILYALLSLIAPGGYSPLQSVLASVCEPVLRPFRRVIPPIAGIDFSPLWAIIITKALLMWLPSLPW